MMSQPSVPRDVRLHLLPDVPIEPATNEEQNYYENEIRVLNNYSVTGNIREVLIVARKTSSRIQESRKKYFSKSATKEK